MENSNDSLDFKLDKSGINSLGGFSYQIKVFAIYAAQIKTIHEQVEFETLDDVVMKQSNIQDDLKYQNISPQTFDNDITGVFKNSDNTYKSIQVKKTKITKNVAINILANWILLENSSYTIKEYILVVEDEYQNKDVLKDITSDELIKNLKEDKKITHKNLLKELLAQNEKKLRNLVDQVKQKYNLETFHINKTLENAYASIFHLLSNKGIFEARLNQFLQEITHRILEQIDNRKPFILTGKEFYQYVEKYTQEISDKKYYISYLNFKKNHPDISISDFSNTREYKQLSFCNLSENRLLKNFQQELYYCDYRTNNLELSVNNNIEDIENRSFENFEDTKDELQLQNNDTPIQRLLSMKEKENEFINENHLKEGSYIYLTKDNIKDIQISWKDEDGTN